METESRIAYKCTNCNYEFSRKKENIISRCPYCSKQGTVKLKSGKQASELLGEVGTNFR